jgi:hypothetical protein
MQWSVVSWGCKRFVDYLPIGRLPLCSFECRDYLFVGSGVIEAGCKTVIASRFKRSGMFWTVRGANTILALRCCHLNGRFEDYWEGRRDAIAA